MINVRGGRRTERVAREFECHRGDEGALHALMPVVYDRLPRFDREAKLLASLKHPHIGAICGLVEADDIRALVLELIDGPTLADRISRDRRRFPRVTSGPARARLDARCVPDRAPRHACSRRVTSAVLLKAAILPDHPNRKSRVLPRHVRFGRCFPPTWREAAWRLESDYCSLRLPR